MHRLETIGMKEALKYCGGDPCCPSCYEKHHNHHKACGHSSCQIHVPPVIPTDIPESDKPETVQSPSPAIKPIHNTYTPQLGGSGVTKVPQDTPEKDSSATMKGKAFTQCQKMIKIQKFGNIHNVLDAYFCLCMCQKVIHPASFVFQYYFGENQQLLLLQLKLHMHMYPQLPVLACQHITVL